MSTDGDHGGGADDAAHEERIVSLLESADRPRRTASDVAEALGLSRGRVRTGLQTLADEGRVVRTDEGTTAWWAASERTGDPAPDDGRDRTDATGGPPETDGAPDGEPDEETDGGPDERGEGSTDESARSSSDEPADRGATAGPADRAETTGRARGAAAEGQGTPGRRLDARGGLALFAALVIAVAVGRRLRRER